MANLKNKKIYISARPVKVMVTLRYKTSMT